jgi:hypothetical protein
MMSSVRRGKTGWLGRLGLGHRRDAAMHAPLLASRDLPPAPRDPETGAALPRSPAPLPEEALRFARHGEARAVDPVDEPEPQPAPANGAELRAMLAQVEERFSLREAIAHAKTAQRRLGDRLEPGRATPRLRLVEDSTVAEQPLVRADSEAALADALALLKRLHQTMR